MFIFNNYGGKAEETPPHLNQNYFSDFQQAVTTALIHKEKYIGTYYILLILQKVVKKVTLDSVLRYPSLSELQQALLCSSKFHNKNIYL